MLILAALLLLLMAWWALSYHIGEFRGDGSTDSGVPSFARPSFPRYHISLGQLALSEPGAHEFRFRGLRDERMTLMLYVQGKTYFRDSALLTSLHTSIEATLIDDGGNTVCKASGSPQVGIDRGGWILTGTSSSAAYWSEDCVNVAVKRNTSYTLTVRVRQVDDCASSMSLVPTLEGGGNELP